MELAGDLILMGGGFIRTAESGWMAEMSSGEFPFRYYNSLTQQPVHVQKKGNVSTTGTLSATLDTAPGIGHLLVAFIVIRDAGRTLTPPAGWTEQRAVPSMQAYGMAVYSKVSEGAADQTLSLSIATGGGTNESYLCVCEVDFGEDAAIVMDLAPVEVRVDYLGTPVSAVAFASSRETTSPQAIEFLLVSVASTSALSDFVAETKVLTAYPASDAAITDFVGVPTDTTGGRWQNIDEDPVSDADYLESSHATTVPVVSTYRMGFTGLSGIIAQASVYWDAQVFGGGSVAAEWWLYEDTEQRVGKALAGSEFAGLGRAERSFSSTGLTLDASILGLELRLTVTPGSGGSEAPTDFSNTAEGGTDEQSVGENAENTGGDSGDAFDDTGHTDPENIPVFDAVDFMHGNLAYRCDGNNFNGHTGAVSYLEMGGLTPSATRYFRMLYRAQTAPSGTTRIMLARGSNTHLGMVGWRAGGTGVIEVRDSANVTAAGSVPLSAGVTYIIEMQIVVGNPGTLVTRVRSMDGTLLDEVAAPAPDTSALGTVTMVDTIRVGARLISGTGSSYIAWVDEVAASTQGWIGPLSGISETYVRLYGAHASLKASTVNERWVDGDEHRSDNAHYDVFSRIPEQTELITADIGFAAPVYTYSMLAIALAAGQQVFWVDADGHVTADRFTATTRDATAALSARPTSPDANVFEGYSSTGDLTSVLTQDGVVELAPVDADPTAVADTALVYAKLVDNGLSQNVADLFIREDTGIVRSIGLDPVRRYGYPRIARLQLASTLGEAEMHNWSLPYPAYAGLTLRGILSGVLDSISTSGTLTLRLRGTGDILLAQVVIPTQASAATNQPFWVEWFHTVRTANDGAGVAFTSLFVRTKMSNTTITDARVVSSLYTGGGNYMNATSEWATQNSGNVLYVDGGYIERVS